MDKPIDLHLLSQHSVHTHFFRNTIWNGYQHTNEFVLKFGIKSLCNHPAFKAEGDRTTIMNSINWKKKQVMSAAIQKTAKIYKDQPRTEQNYYVNFSFTCCQRFVDIFSSRFSGIYFSAVFRYFHHVLHRWNGYCHTARENFHDFIEKQGSFIWKKKKKKKVSIFLEGYLNICMF